MRNQLRVQRHQSVVSANLEIISGVLQSLMPWDVRVDHVVPGQPEFRGAPVLNTVLRKPGLQVPLLDGDPLEEGLDGAAVLDPLVCGGCIEDVFKGIAAGQTAAMLLVTNKVRKSREDILIDCMRKQRWDKKA